MRSPLRFLLPFILLAFPFAEIFLLVKLGHLYGWWLAVYLVAITWLGLQLIKSEKQLFSAKMMQSLNVGGNPINTVLGSARNLFAGILLVFPGIITDIIAAIVLLLPLKQNTISPNTQNQSRTHDARSADAQAANDDIIEGEFTEIKENNPALK